MSYTVKQVAELSGVTVRTLHFYDEAGLLKPAYHAPNGYRHYGEKELLILQQILFFRELGFEIKKIRRLLGRGDFDKAAALRSHREALEHNLKRTRELIRTIDKTLAHMEGKKKMKDSEMFAGFDEAQQAKYEDQLVERFGGRMREQINRSKQKVKNWTKADWQKNGMEWDAICKDLALAMKQGLEPASPQVQEIVDRHYKWLQHFWKPDRESYAGHGQFLEDSGLKHAYDKYDPGLAKFLKEGIAIFADQRLP